MIPVDEKEQYYPLVLTGEGWEIEFQLRPDPCIKVTGKPSDIDILRAVSSIAIPGLIIAQVIEICCLVKEKTTGDEK